MTELAISPQSSSITWKKPSSVESLIGNPQQSGVVYIAIKGTGVYQYVNPERSPVTIRVPEEFPTIQAALDASMRGDTVLVGPGRYEENLDFRGKGILLTSTAGSDKTIIDGQNGSVITFAAGEDSTACINGFTIRNGLGTLAADDHRYGGGIYCSSASPRITHNVITENNVLSGCGAYGGGIAILGNSHPLIKGNRLTLNSSSSVCDALVNYGGGVYVCGSSTPVLRENIIVNNYADFGSGIAVQDSARPIIQQNRIANNPPNDILVGPHALPIIGGFAGMGNDMSQEQEGGRGSCLLRFGNGQVVNAQYNYFGVCPPDENKVYPLEQFDTQNCSNWSLRDYFPMEIGNCWIFQTTPIGAPPIATMSETIIDTLTIAGLHFYRFDQFRGLDHPLLRLTPEDKLTWRLDPMSVLEHVWVDFAAEVGDRWQLHTGTANWTVELQSKTDRVTVSAGTFSNCYSYHFSFAGADNDWHEWYAPGIGPVKRILYGYAVIEYSLLSARLHGMQVSVAKHSSETIVEKPALYQNYPNPFNSATVISYELPASSYVILEIFNITGQKVRTLVAQHQQPGKHQVQWDGTRDDATGLPSGLYIYRLYGSDWSMYGKLVLLR